MHICAVLHKVLVYVGIIEHLWLACKVVLHMGGVAHLCWACKSMQICWAAPPVVVLSGAWCKDPGCLCICL